MIAISVRKDGITVSGHAGYAPAGQDIVCAGVSALTSDKIKYKISPGGVDIEYRNLSEKTKTLVDSFFIGIIMIADEFPDYVRVM